MLEKPLLLRDNIPKSPRLTSFLFHEKKKQYRILFMHIMTGTLHTLVAIENVQADAMQSTFGLYQLQTLPIVLPNELLIIHKNLTKLLL